MSKTLETKKRIMNLLKKRQMTISELSRELGLSSATVSQHMDELQQIGAIEKVDNEHFKKLKYYKTRETQNMPIAAKYVIGVIVIVVAALAITLYTPDLIKQGQVPQTTLPLTSPQAASNAATRINNSTAVPTGGGTGTGAFECPIEDYVLNGSVTEALGMRRYNLSYYNTTISDYVLAPGSSGTLNATEMITHLLNQGSSINNGREHTVTLYREQSNQPTFNSTYTGINATITPATFNATSNETLHVTVTIATNATAAGTYWVAIEGPCGGSVTPVLVTIGNGPYNGTITPPHYTYM